MVQLLGCLRAQTKTSPSSMPSPSTSCFLVTGIITHSAAFTKTQGSPFIPLPQTLYPHRQRVWPLYHPHICQVTPHSAPAHPHALGSSHLTKIYQPLSCVRHCPQPRDSGGSRTDTDPCLPCSRAAHMSQLPSSELLSPHWISLLKSMLHRQLGS